MPRTNVTVTDTSRAGANQPAQQNSDQSNGMQLDWNDGKIVLELSAVTATTTFTIQYSRGIDGQTAPTRVIAVTTATPVVVGPFPPDLFNQADGKVYIDVNSTNGRIHAYHLV